MPRTIVPERPPATHATWQGDGLRALVQAARSEPALQQSLATSSSLSELVERARQAGHTISVRELQLWANHPDLQHGSWPWAELNEAERLEFFRRG